MLQKFQLIGTILIIVVVSSTPCVEGMKVTIEKIEIFSEGGDITGHEELSAEHLASLRAQFVADYGTYLVAEVAEADLDQFHRAAAEAELVAHERPEFDLIQINGYTFPSSGRPHDLPEDLEIDEYDGSLGFYLVQFKAPIKTAWRKQLETLAQVIAFYPENTHLVRIPNSSAHILSELDHVQHVSLFQPAYKIRRQLLDVDQQVDVTIHMDPDQDLTDVQTLLGNLAGNVVEIRGESDSPIARAVLEATSLRDIVHWPEIMWVEPTLSVEFSGERSAMVVGGQHNGTRPDVPETGGVRSGHHEWLTDDLPADRRFCTPTEAPTGCNPYWTKVAVFDSGLDDYVCPTLYYDTSEGTCSSWTDSISHPDLDHASNLSGPSGPCGGLSSACDDDIVERFFCVEDVGGNNLCHWVGGYHFFDNRSPRGHGTAVATIIAGDPLDEGSPEKDDGNYYRGTGVAPSAQIISAKIGDNIYDGTGSGDVGFSEDEYQALMTAVEATHTRFANNSWNLYDDWYEPPKTGGKTVTTTSRYQYSGFSKMMDRLVRDANGTFNNTNDPMTIVFSAGNHVDSQQPQWVISPANAKNVISVGASLGWTTGDDFGEDEGAAHGDCSTVTTTIKDLAGGVIESSMSDDDFHTTRMYIGEDDSGQYLPRYKPDLVAPGDVLAAGRTQYYSYDDDDDYYCFGGTSAAAPVVTGAAVLADAWYYWEMAYPEIASPAMIKALLVAHADTLAGGTDYYPSPDETLGDSPSPPQGWGRVNLSGLFQDDYAFVVIDEDHASTPVRRFTDDTDYWSDVFVVDDSTEHIIIVLAFTDYFSEPNASGGLKVNDIDLKAYSTGLVSKTYWGNYFGSNWYSNNALSIPRYIPDPRNTVEVIRIPANAITGQFTIRVSARTIDENAVPGLDSGDPNQDWALYVHNASVY